MIRPTLPESRFSIDCPNLGDINQSIRKKRNKAAAGLNALTYVPYKKCPAILKFILQLFRKIWKTKDIPTDWACAYIVLLSKSENFSQVSEFRPIAITSTVSKIFFSIISSRLQVFFKKATVFFIKHYFIPVCFELVLVPKDVQQLIFDYYEQLRAMVITNEC